MKKYLIALLFLATFTGAKAQIKDNANLGGNEVFTKVEVSAQFPGGPEKLYKFLSNNLRYPEQSKIDNLQGKVFLTFIVEKDGSLTNFKILRSLSPKLDAEAIRVFERSPKWSPARQNNKPVRQQYRLPIVFSLNKR